MAKKIFKYELDSVTRQTIIMPEGATILSAQVQNGRLCLWASVDPDGGPDHREFVLVGTGDDAPPEPSKHLATIQVSGGSVVLHLFEQLRA